MRRRVLRGRSADGLAVRDVGKRVKICGVRIGVLGCVRCDIRWYGLDARKPSWFYRCHI